MDKEKGVLGKMPSVAVLARLPQGKKAAGDSGPVSIAALTNLWPRAVASARQEAGEAYIGEGMPPIPQKLAAKMLR